MPSAVKRHKCSEAYETTEIIEYVDPGILKVQQIKDHANVLERRKKERFIDWVFRTVNVRVIY